MKHFPVQCGDSAALFHFDYNGEKGYSFARSETDFGGRIFQSFEQLLRFGLRTRAIHIDYLSSSRQFPTMRPLQIPLDFTGDEPANQVTMNGYNVQVEYISIEDNPVRGDCGKYWERDGAVKGLIVSPLGGIASFIRLKPPSSVTLVRKSRMVNSLYLVKR